MSGVEGRLRQRIGTDLKARCARGEPIWYLKVHGGPYQRDGVVDWLISVRGRLVGIETKAPGEKLRPNQVAERRWMLRSGNEHYVLEDFQTFQRLMDELLADDFSLQDRVARRVGRSPTKMGLYKRASL